MNLKNSFIFGLTMLAMASCQDPDFTPAPEKQTSNETSSINNGIGLLSFKSADELNEAMQTMHAVQRVPKGMIDVPLDTARGDDFKDIFTPVGELEQYAQIDPIIELELASTKNYIEDTRLLDDMSIYDACGYEELVPENDFAKLLNARGEIEVNDTVYKISKQGTYFFHVSLYKYFTNKYKDLECTNGTKVSDKTYLVDDNGIYRYETFDSIETVDAEDSVLPDTLDENFNIPFTPPLKSSYSEEVQWDKLPTYDADAKTIVGKLWQSLFGRNKSQTYKISKNRRVRGKFYFFNYRVHVSTGVQKKKKKKNWIGWSGTEADKLTINWHNIVFETKYPSPVPSGYYQKNALAVSPAEERMMIGYTDKIPVVSILGYEISDSELNSLVSKSASEVYSYLKSKIGKPIPGNARAYMLYGERRIVTILPDGYIDGNRKKEIEKKFFDDWRFAVSLNLTNFASSWKSWLKFMNGQSISDPKLICGEVRVAASLDNKWGGMKIIKQVKK